jgi:hypothetical protein
VDAFPIQTFNAIGYIITLALGDCRRSKSEGMMSARYLAVALAMMVLVPVEGLAKGAPTPVHVVAAIPPVVLHTLPDISAEKLLSGCGGHRYRDPVTQQCRGF